MKAGQAIEQDVPVQFSLRISKVDKATREVEGVCTQEVTDVHGEIVDHESIKAALLDWPGNIREMHQPIAVGKAVSVVSDDDAKATILRARVSKGAPDTWTKVEDGTLSMYSIGGSGKRVVTKKADGSVEKRVFVNKLSEVSLVDNGACPTAKFDIVKMVDGVATHVQPEEPAEAPVAKEVAVLGAARVLELVAKLAAFGAPAEAPQATAVAATVKAQLEAVSIDPAVVEKKAYPTPYNIEQTLGAIALLERILADEWWKVLDLANYDQQSDLSTDRTQVQVLRNAISLVISYLMSEFEAQFADFDELTNNGVTVANAAITRRAELVEKAAFDLPVVFSKLDGTGQLWFAKAGARHSKADTQMVQAMHDTAVGLGAVDCAKCAASTEKVADAPADIPAVPVVTEKVDAPAQPAAPEPIAKEAEATPAAAAAPVQEPVAGSDTPVQQAAGMTADAVETIVKAALDQALAAQKATSDAAIAALEARVEKLSNEPMPGGPKARATGTEGTPVHKSLGNVTSELDGIDPASLQSFAEELAKHATPEERERIAQNLLKFQHRTGTGAVVISQTVARRNE